MINLRSFREPQDPRLCDYLPWALIVAPGVVEQKDGLLQKTIEFRGPDLASIPQNGLMMIAAKLNNAFRRLGSGWSFFVEAQRNSTQAYPVSSWPNDICRLIDEERKREFEKEGRHFESRYYLTFVYGKPAMDETKILSFLTRGAKDDDGQEDLLAYFLEETSKLVSLLELVMPHVKELDDEETLTYLHSTISTRRHPVRVPEVPMYIDAIIVDEAVEHGLETKLGDSFLRTLTINGFPGSTFPGILNGLNELGCEYRWVSRYIAFSKEDARKELGRFRKRWYSKRKGPGSVIVEVATHTESALSNTDATRKAEDADDALQALEDDHVSYGHFTATVTVWGKQRKEADERLKSVQSVIHSRGFTTHLETLQSTQAWFGSLPGHVYANVRRPILHSLNFVHLLPVSAVWAGPEKNTHLNGPPHMVVRTNGNSLFRLCTNVGDVGHTLILGPTGAGKSTLLSFMALQWLRYKNAQVYIFDKGGSARAATLAAGGNYSMLGSTDSPAFQPLKDIHDEHERIFAQEWLLQLLGMEGVPETPLLKKELWNAISSLSTRPPADRSLTVLRGLLQEQALRDALRPYTLDGHYGRLLDASQETLTFGAWQTFEMEMLMEQKGVVAPCLSYLFHRLEKRFDGSPTLLILDEAWLFFDHPLFAEKIRAWLKILRKANVYVIFATQSLADAMASPIASVILESCLTKIFLPNDAAREPAIRPYYEKIGLNEKQIDIISHAVPKRDYYFHSRGGNRLFELALGPTALAFCASSSKDDHRLMDASADSDGFAAAFLQSKGLSRTPVL